MTAVLLTQSVVIAVLCLLVFSLLRSHAEILRRLHEIDPAGAAHSYGANHPQPFQVRHGVALPRDRSPKAVDLFGTTARGEQVALAVRGSAEPTLLAFLSSGCVTCLEFWAQLTKMRQIGSGLRVVVITKGPEQENAGKIAQLAGAHQTVVMSTQAWLDYEVPMAPYFILVDGPTGEVRGEGSAGGWRQLVDLMEDAGARPSAPRRGMSPAEREARIDKELSAAGIQPGDPSLYPVHLPQREHP